MKNLVRVAAQYICNDVRRRSKTNCIAGGTRLGPWNSVLRCAIVTTALCATSVAGATQEKAFNGFYGGAEVGRQKIIGGSLVSGIDVLAEGNRAVLSVSGGFRYQFGVGFVIGAEGSFGITDGNLNFSDPAQGLNIVYENSGQTTLGLMGGFTLGESRTWLIFGYLSEATRKFDVTIRQGGTMLQQRDEQGFLRYGGGVEVRISGPLNLRASVGTGRADFGDQQTNITVERSVESAIGMLIQF